MTHRVSAGAAVLLVEDDDETRSALVRELTARGYRVDAAPNAENQAIVLS